MAQISPSGITTSSVDWWANLLQGGLSAVVGGVVAAVTAWFVVSQTRRNDRLLSREIAVREAAIRLSDVMVTLSADVQCAVAKQRFWRLRGHEQELITSHVAFAAAIFALGPVMMPVDRDFALHLQCRCKEISDLLPTHARPCRPSDLAKAQKMLDDLILSVSAWLSDPHNFVQGGTTRRREFGS